MRKVQAYAAPRAGAELVPFAIARRATGERDLRIEIAYCGICHSDIHQVRDEWGGASFPMVPGHEIVGRVVEAGRKVRRFKPGDLIGIGCLVGSCGDCPSCRRGLEQHCLDHVSWTYNGTEVDRKTPTYGGYSKEIVVDEAFALRVPPKLPPEKAAPLLCAGITTYSPLKRLKLGRRSRVGVLGLGGLGHMAVKLASALGAEVTVLSRSRAKEADALRLGAHAFVLSSDPGAAAGLEGRLDAIIDTVSAPHDLDAALSWLKTEGTLVMVGASPSPLPVGPMPLIGGRRSLAGSLIGGIAETQEMLDFCAKKKLGAEVEVIPIAKVNEAYRRVLAGEVRYRFVIDLATL